jgi:multiple sugar transport system ATP-binding protein
MAMVFQSYALYPTMTVRENLDFGLRMAKVPKAEIDRRVAWAADLLKLSDYLDRKPARLSGGQRQRVAIGRAIVREAKVYLFDEPLSNLDAKLRAEMRLEIRRLHAKLGATMVYVTHDQVEAMTMATRIAVMKNGVVEQFATPSEIYDKPSTLYVAGFVGSPGMNFLSGKLRANGGMPEIELTGANVDISGYGFATSTVSDKDVVLGVRPEDLQINEGTPLLKNLPVESLELLGADSIVWFTYEGQRISARVAPSKAPTVGQRVSLGFTPSRASIFDAVTEQRI